MTVQEELTRDLYTYLVNELCSVPYARRQRSCWVMNREWYDECRKIGAPSETSLRYMNLEHAAARHGWPEPGVTTMLGLPFVVAENGGFPHLIAD